MPLQLSEGPNGRYLVIHATGKLVEEDYKYFIPEFEQMCSHNPAKDKRDARVLFDMTGLHGWDAGAAWEDIKFDVKHFNDIARLAIVGDKPWQHGLATLFSPFTRAKTRYFDSRKISEARHWLSEPVVQP